MNSMVKTNNRIILVGNTSWSMIKFRKALMQTLVREGYDLYVLAPPDDHTHEIEKCGARHIPIEIDNQGANPFKDAKLIYRLQKLYKKIDPALIFHYTIKPNIYGTFATKLAKKRSIAVVTGLGYTFINNSLSAKIAKLLYKLSFRYAYQVWFINQTDASEFINRRLVNESKIVMLQGEGIDTRHFEPLPQKEKAPHTFHFVLIARLLWDKGVGEYVKAAKELKKRYPGASFQLVGFIDSKNPQAISKAQVAYWTQEGYIDYLGTKEDVRETIANADAVVLPSYREGLSMILLEAAAMAKPLIATNVPGCNDIVIDELTGFLCKPKDFHDLMKKMEKMLRLPQKRREHMGKQAREHVLEYYDEEIVVQKYLDTIHLLLPNSPANRFHLGEKRSHDTHL